MGSGGIIKLTNNTAYNWKRTKSEQYQMEHWNFPETISRNASVDVYFEFVERAGKFPCDDTGKVWYSLEGTNKEFQITAKGHGSWNKYHFTTDVQLNNINLKFPHSSSIDLGWWHDSGMQHHMPFTLSELNGGFLCDTYNHAQWMKDHMSVIGNRTLKQICIPGSHDAGMSMIDGKTLFAKEGNTVTQLKGQNINMQLKEGVRYFDIRPCIGNGGQLLTGHYSDTGTAFGWQGANGESLKAIADGITKFSQATGGSELIILALSHSLQSDSGYRKLNTEEWNRVLNILKHIPGICSAEKFKNRRFIDVPIKELLNCGNVILCVNDAGESVDYNANSCVFNADSLNLYDSYSDTNDLGRMANDQIDKMKRNQQKYFLLSWTLTQSGLQATAGSPPILWFARCANGHLPSILPHVSESCFPNIVYTDSCNAKASYVSMAVNYKILSNR